MKYQFDYETELTEDALETQTPEVASLPSSDSTGDEEEKLKVETNDPIEIGLWQNDTRSFHISRTFENNDDDGTFKELESVRLVECNIDGEISSEPYFDSVDRSIMGFATGEKTVDTVSLQSFVRDTRGTLKASVSPMNDFCQNTVVNDGSYCIHNKRLFDLSIGCTSFPFISERRSKLIGSLGIEGKGDRFATMSNNDAVIKMADWIRCNTLELRLAQEPWIENIRAATCSRSSTFNGLTPTFLLDSFNGSCRKEVSNNLRLRRKPHVSSKVYFANEILSKLYIQYDSCRQSCTYLRHNRGKDSYDRVMSHLRISPEDLSQTQLSSNPFSDETSIVRIEKKHCLHPVKILATAMQKESSHSSTTPSVWEITVGVTVEGQQHTTSRSCKSLINDNLAVETRIDHAPLQKSSVTLSMMEKSIPLSYLAVAPGNISGIKHLLCDMQNVNSPEVDCVRSKDESFAGLLKQQKRLCNVSNLRICSINGHAPAANDVRGNQSTVKSHSEGTEGGHHLESSPCLALDSTSPLASIELMRPKDIADMEEEMPCCEKKNLQSDLTQEGDHVTGVTGNKRKLTRKEKEEKRQEKTRRKLKRDERRQKRYESRERNKMVKVASKEDDGKVHQTPNYNDRNIASGASQCFANKQIHLDEGINSVAIKANCISSSSLAKMTAKDELDMARNSLRKNIEARKDLSLPIRPLSLPRATMPSSRPSTFKSLSSEKRLGDTKFFESNKLHKWGKDSIAFCNEVQSTSTRDATFDLLTPDHSNETAKRRIDCRTYFENLPDPKRIQHHRSLSICGVTCHQNEENHRYRSTVGGGIAHTRELPASKSTAAVSGHSNTPQEQARNKSSNYAGQKHRSFLNGEPHITSHPVVQKSIIPMKQRVISLLCSEAFFESWGAVVGELATGRWAISRESGGAEEAAARNDVFSVHLIDSSLVDDCGVDIELPGRGGMLVFTTSAMATAAYTKSIVLQVADLQAIGRYSVLYIFLCYDCAITMDIAKHITQLQCAAIASSEAPATMSYFKAVCLSSIAASISGTVSIHMLSEQVKESPRHESIVGCVTDELYRERARFLLQVVPTLSASGAMECLLIAQETLPGELYFKMLFQNERLRQQIILMASSPSQACEVHPDAMNQLSRALVVSLSTARQT